MPSGYAHHRFGSQIIPQLPADIRGPVLRNRELFDLGLHGPDFLFFHHFFKQTPLFHLGAACHEKSGKSFFQDACACVKSQPSESARAYLYGLLAHYCLDSDCHSFVYDMTDGTGLGHAELETEFDRYLMLLDGIRKPHTYNIFQKYHPKKEAFDIISRFYPDLSPKDVAVCIRAMFLSRYLLTIPTAAGHKAVSLFTQVAAGNTGGQHMTIGPNPKCEHLDIKLMELYRQSLARYPILLEQLNHHMDYSEPFGDEFIPNFNRG